jgi:cardiolipin synthase
LITNTVTSAVRSLFGNKADGKTMKDLAEEPTSKFEDQILRLFSSMVERGQLIPYINRLLAAGKKIPILGKQVEAMSQDRIDTMISMLDESFTQTAYMRGHMEKSKHIEYVEWNVLSDRIEATLAKQESLRTKPVKNSIHDPYFMKELMELGQVKYAIAEDVRPLVDGPASYAVRERMIKEAKESIDMMSWGMLDDFTGMDLAQRLIAKVKEGVKVRFVVDGQVARRKGYRDALAKMEAGGVEVMRWFHPLEPYQGQHRKMLITDGTEMVAGGINPGDAYSHKAGDPKFFWRDTDLYVRGGAVDPANQLFARLWNEQVDGNRMALKPMSEAKAKRLSKADRKIRIGVIDHSPNSKEQNGSTLILTMIKAIRGAEKSVDIENAYVVMFPALMKEIEAAVKRKVRVRVLTNSSHSIDEPLISSPIVRSAVKLAEVGAEVYVKKGPTLHSKFLVVDSQLSLVGSYNLHPRSEKMEGEMGLLVNDKKIGQEMTAIMDQDVSPEKADRLDPLKVEIPQSIPLLVILRLMFDQL